MKAAQTRLPVVRSFVLLVLLSLGSLAQAGEHESVIIGCDGNCMTVMARVQEMGGTISHEYKNINAVSAVLPVGARAALLASDGLAIAYKDATISSPRPIESVTVNMAPGTSPITGQALEDLIVDLPDDYSFNNGLIGATALHQQGISGAGVIVAVIDSGSANNPVVVRSIAGKVIGGENFVPGAGEPSATSTLNNPHGTNVATQISANVGFGFFTSGSLVQSMLVHAPDSVILDVIPGVSVIPMVGVAPDAQIYAMKVFSAFGGGSPESRIIAAMDRAITLKRNFNNGMASVPVSGDGSEDNPYVYESLNIQVVNMSLGGATLFAGADLEDSMTQQMLDVGITLVASAGNEGHAAMTGGSPGTGIGSLTSGAMSSVAHERILRDLQFGLGAGDLYRPSDHQQMATFSSRGPSADGRISTNAVASGLATLAQNANGGISLASGTSFSSPQMAGAAALLRGAVPGASATQIRNALEDYANPNLLGDNSAPIDQGRGVIDLPASLAALQAGHVRSDLNYGKASDRVHENIKSLGFNVIKVGNGYMQRIENLVPGQVEHIFLRSDEKTQRFDISLTNIQPALPPAEQNAFFGDDLYVKVQDAVTSDEATVYSGFLFSDTSITFDQPQTGVVRIAIMGDWTNAGMISADLTITEYRGHEEDETDGGKVAQSETDVIFIDMPAGTTEASFALRWKNNWGSYPTDDLDLFLVDPSGAVIYDGATLRSPERVLVDNPLPGTWVAFVDGFTVHGVIDHEPTSEWKLTAMADGEVLEIEDDDDHDDDDDDDEEHDD